MIVDEAHHLLTLPGLYSLTQQLSKVAPGFLLLSAIPAQHREEEYLRLLALLEPGRYEPDIPGAKKHFKQLYDRQIELGRKLSYIGRRLDEFATGTESADRILQKVAEMVSLPVLAQDESLVASSRMLNPNDPKNFIQGTQALLHHVGDRYRISRRILRNRRSQLMDVEPDLNINRLLTRLPYTPDQLELEAINAVQRLIQRLAELGVKSDLLLPLARYLYHSLADATCLSEFVAFANASERTSPDILEFDGQVGYAAWSPFASSLWSKVNALSAEEALNDLQLASSNWEFNDVVPARMDVLITFLKKRHKKEPRQKFLIFAGFFGLAERMAKHLVDAFGKGSVSRFIWDMDTKSKEKEVLRFQRDSQCWLMISDETGGEGRNFQFVDELIHFDIPWNVSKIEQRIGRLDRLGRQLPEVCSNSIFAVGHGEEGFLDCLENGFEIFKRSISGLEFALSNLESRITQTAITNGYEGLFNLTTEVKKDVETERAEDEVQGMLDSASLERTSAEVFRKAQSTPERDVALETAFSDWFRFLAGNGSLGFPSSGDAPEKSVIEFRPNLLPQGFLALDSGSDGVIRDRLGTFRRKIAQERPDLEFFSVGNELFDALCSSLHESPKGRTYALECQASHVPWRGFEFSYRLTGGRELLRSHPGLLKHLDRVLAVRTECCFIREDLTPAPDTQELLGIRKSLGIKGHNDTWRNFTLSNGRTQLLLDFYSNIGWEALINRAEAVARTQVAAHYALSLVPVLKLEEARIREQIRQAKDALSDGWKDEIAGLEALLHAINNWNLDLDTVGFFSVNGGLIP